MHLSNPDWFPEQKIAARIKMSLKILELFSGTGSIGKVFRKHDHEVIAVDVDGRFGCEIQDDILQFAYVKLPWVPDIIWASPPCTEYSRAKTTGIRNLELADKLVAKFIEIRDYFLELNPSMLWFCENGQTTMLWDREVAKTLEPRAQLSYCQYGKPYRKNNNCHKCCLGPFAKKMQSQNMHNDGKWSAFVFGTTRPKQKKGGIEKRRCVQQRFATFYP